IFVRPPSVSLAAMIRASSSAALASEYSAGIGPCRGAVGGAVYKVEAPEPKPGLVSICNGAVGSRLAHGGVIWEGSSKVMVSPNRVRLRCSVAAAEATKSATLVIGLLAVETVEFMVVRAGL